MKNLSVLIQVVGVVLTTLVVLKLYSMDVTKKKTRIYISRPNDSFFSRIRVGLTCLRIRFHGGKPVNPFKLERKTIKTSKTLVERDPELISEIQFRELAKSDGLYVMRVFNGDFRQRAKDSNIAKTHNIPIIKFND